MVRRLAITVGLLLSLLAVAPAGAAEGCRDWAVVPSPDVSLRGDNTFAAVAGRRSDDVWAVGQFDPDSNLSITQTFAAHYDGTAWSASPSPNLGSQANALHSVAVTPSDRVWAVGYHIDDHSFLSHSLIEFWDGVMWRVSVHPADPGVSAVLFGVAAVADDDVWAVGEFQAPLDRFHALIEHFDGTAWLRVAAPEPGVSGNILYGVAAAGRDSVWAVGERNGSRSPDAPLILRWNGTAWSAAPAPRDGASTTRLYGIAADGSGLMHAAGEEEDDPRGTFALTEIGGHGRPWALRSAAQVGASDNHLYGIAAAADGTAWATGAYFEPASGRQFTLVERGAAGGAWTAMPSPSPSHGGDSLLAGAAAIGRDLWAVGAYDGPQAQRSLILHACR